MLLYLELELALDLFDKGVEVFAGDFLDFFALATDEGVVAIVEIFFHLAANEAFDAVDFVDEMEMFEYLNDPVDRDGVEVDFVLLERDFGDLVGRKRATRVGDHFNHGHARAGDFVTFLFECVDGEFSV